MAAGAVHAAAVPDPKPIMTMGASSNAASPNHQLAGLQTEQDTVTAPGEKDSKLADPAAGLGGEGGSPATLSADKMGQSQMQADGQQSEEDDVDDVSSDDVLDEDDGVSDIPDGASESASLSLVPQPSTLSEGRGVRATSLWWESFYGRPTRRATACLNESHPVAFPDQTRRRTICPRHLFLLTVHAEIPLTCCGQVTLIPV